MNKEDSYAIYIRVSSDRQASEGDSIEMQENLGVKLIEENNGTLYKVYIEPAVSASKTALKDRKILMECLNDAQANKFNNLIVYKRDRLARKTEDSLAIRRILSEANCNILFTARGEQQMTLNDPNSKLIENIFASMDEIESIKISVRVSDVLEDKAKRGEFTGGGIPYGYKVIGGIVTPIEDDIYVIREIEKLYLSGYGTYSIAKYMNGHKNSIGKREAIPRRRRTKRDGDKWTKDIISSILHSYYYTGYIKHNDLLVKSDQIIPMRDEATQQRINEMRITKKQVAPRKYNTSYLLTGILRCGKCGKHMVSTTSSKNSSDNVYFYYVCQGRRTPESFCNSKSIRKEIVEEKVINEIKKYIKHFIDDDVYEGIKKGLMNNTNEYGSELKSLEQQLNIKKKEFTSLRRLLIELNPDDSMYEILRDNYQDDQKQVLISIKELEGSVKSLKGKIETHEDSIMNVEQIADKLKDFLNVFDEAEINDKKMAIEKLFRSIVIDEELNIHFDLSFDNLPDMM